MSTGAATDSLRSRCYLCGSSGKALYSSLPDRTGRAHGRWDLQRCVACGLLWLDPQPSAAALSDAYQAYYTHRVASAESLHKRLHDAIMHSHLQRRFRYRLHAPAGVWPLSRLHPGGESELGSAVMFLMAPRGSARLLDVGCGNGRFLIRMRRLGWSVEGVDPDPTAIALARRARLRVREGDVESQDYPSDHFDAICLNHVIEHVADPIALLRSCRRILKPDGQLVVTTPNTSALGHRLFGSHWFHLDPPRHLFLFNGPTLRETAKQSHLSLTSLASTVRGARLVWTSSRDIGTARRTKAQGTLLSNLRGVPFQQVERALLMVRRWDGEELLLIATKQ